MKYIIIIIVLTILPVTYSFAEQPNESFMRSKIACGDGYTYISEYVKIGLKPGKWKKASNGAWLYKIVDHDEVTNKVNYYTFAFNKHGNSQVTLDRVAINGNDLNIFELAALNMNILTKLPTCQTSHEDNTKKQSIISNQRAKQGLAEAIKESLELITDSFVSKIYTNENVVTRNINIIDVNSKYANFEFTSKLDDINICDISVKNARVEIIDNNITLGDNKLVGFIISNDQDECSVRLKLYLTKWADKSTFKQLIPAYRGNCEKYCNLSIIDKLVENEKYNEYIHNIIYPINSERHSFKSLKSIKIEEVNNNKQRELKEQEESWK